MTIEIGKKAPDFCLPSTTGNNVSLKDYQGKIIVLYFYPRDNTPGCTQQGIDFSANITCFKRKNAVVLGVSRDSVASHEKFVAKQGFKFTLISDAEESACQSYDVMKDKNMYGKKVRGIERSTFLIDQKGVVQNVWRKVKVAGHVDEVLSAVKQFAKA